MELFNPKKILAPIAVVGIFLTVGVAPASALLSNVGPHLSSNPSKAKVQVETMLHHDKAIQAFYVRHSPSSAHLTMQDIASAKVTDLRFGKCRIGVSKKCPINTGKDASGNVVKTSFRFGEVRPVAYVTIEIGKEVFEFTLESPCVNLLSPLFPVFVPLPPRPPRPPHIPVSPKKPITYQLVSTSYSISTSTSSSTAVCPAGTVESVASSGAGAGAEAKATATVYFQKRHAWGSLFEKINSISTTTYTNTGTGTSVTCTPKPPGPCEVNPKECEEEPSSSCKTEPAAEKCKPIVRIETINDMLASANGHHHPNTICWEVEPGVESSLSTIQTFLVAEYGETISGVEYRGGYEFCQEYEPPSEPVMEEIYAYAKDVKTLAYGVSKTQRFQVKLEPNF